MDYIERNYKILQDRMLEQMDYSLDLGNDCIDTELDAGALNFAVKPIVRAFYSYWVDNEAKKGTREQIRITLDIAKKILKSGNDSKEYFEKLINENFSDYLKNDQTDQQCKPTHENYEKLKQITRETLVTQVEETMLFFSVQEEVRDYAELSRAAFKTKENAYNALIRQLDLNESGIEIVEKDISILKILVGKEIIIKVLRKAFDLTKQYLIDQLDEIFDEN